MTETRRKQIELLVNTIPELTAGQLHWLQRVVSVFKADHRFSLSRSSLFDDMTLENFGDAMRIHHSFSAEPFSKDKFEYVFVQVLRMSGRNAELAPKGNPGHDVTMNGVRLSLKTQADKSIKPDVIWISKFMELGKGKWKDKRADLEGLRNQFLAHMKNYDRIIMLRALAKGPHWHYELLEIPKELLEQAQHGSLKMMKNSKQLPKPGYCHVRDSRKDMLFELYFDGGSERKLQIKNLGKEHCMVHASWEFVIPLE